MSEASDKAFARKGRIAGLVIAAGGLLALFAPAITASLGLGPRHEMLLYLVSLAAFIWAMVVAFQMWQTRRTDRN